MPTPQQPQSPNQRRRPPLPPVTPPRRPKVAGLRRPSPGPRGPETGEPTPEQQNEQTNVIPKITGDAGFGGSLGASSAAGTVEDERPAGAATDTETERPARPRRRRPRVDRPADEVDAPSVDDTPAWQSDSGSTADTPGWAPTSGGDERDPSTGSLAGAGSGTDSGAGRNRAAWLLTPMVLGVVAVVFGALAVAAGISWWSLTHDASLRNTALIDNAGTSEVTGEVTTAVNTMFSYNYTNLSKTQQAVQQLLTGNAVCEYNELFADVKTQAPVQKLVLTTTVVSSGVEMLDGGTARVLLVVDQHDTRATTNQSSDSTAAFAVNAIQSGGKWKISEIDTFNGANPTCSSK